MALLLIVGLSTVASWAIYLTLLFHRDGIIEHMTDGDTSHEDARTNAKYATAFMFWVTAVLNAATYLLWRM